MEINYFFKSILLVCSLFFVHLTKAQVTFGVSGSYGLRLINPSYAGKAINVRRTCDNATLDIGFSCGGLDTTALLNFTVLSNELAGVTSSANCATAYSLRKLSCTYVGNAINVRRSSDNTTLDIGFTANGDLDTASLTAFVTINSGFITKWYDQSGNARDASQATVANQPRIVNAGVIDRQKGMPAIFFNNVGAGGYTIGLQTAAFSTFATAAFFLGVAAVNTNLTYNALVTKTGLAPNKNQPCPFDFYYNTGANVTNILTGDGTAGGASFHTTVIEQFKAGVASGNLSIWTYQSTNAANSVQAFWNASTQIITNQSPVAGRYADQVTPLCIGIRSDGVTGLNGWVSEVLTFNAIPSAADIGYLEYTQGQYYGIAGPTFSAPSSVASLDAYITKWYDQSGNGVDASQAVAADQPLIVSNGVINRQKAPATSFLPSINFNGTTQDLSSAGFIKAFNNTAGGGGTLNMIAVNNGAASWQGMAQQGRTSGTWWGIWGSNTGKWTGSFSAGPGNMISATNSSVLECITLIQLPTVSTTLFGNGTQLLTNATMANMSSGNAFFIGLGNAGEYWNGNASEINIFSTGLNTTQRTLLETNQGAYYGLTPTNSKYTPANGYNLFVNGIGETSAADIVSSTNQSAGMGFVDVSFLGVGNYMTSGMTCPFAKTSFANLPVGFTAGYERWANDWLINITNPAATAGNIQIYFDFADYGVSAFGSPAIASNYQLWGRATPASTFTVVPTTGIPTIVGNRITFTLPVANLANGGYYTIGTIDYNNSSLPIQLLSFNAIPNGEKVDITWETVTEQNNAFFTIERSQDGINFTILTTVNSKANHGNSTTALNYQTTDFMPYSGTSYYRLKQTDYNNNYKYFNIVSVNFNEQQSIRVYPNPNNGSFVIEPSNTTKQTMQVYDVNGKLVLSQVINGKTTIDANSLNEGVYNISLISNEGVVNKRLVIVK
ncbi:MAG: T9SS type A sorting domain-containing protein [Bacteroidia bacterium]